MTGYPAWLKEGSLGWGGSLRGAWWLNCGGNEAEVGGYWGWGYASWGLAGGLKGG